MGGVKHHAVASFTDPSQRSEIGDEIVITKSGAAFSEEKLCRAKLLQLLRNIFHVPWGKKLTFLYVHSAPGLRGCLQQISLAAKEGWDLQQIDELARHCRFGWGMHVRRYGNFQFSADGSEDFAPGASVDSAKRCHRGAIGFVIGCIENEGNVFRVANLRNLLRHSSDEFF